MALKKLNDISNYFEKKGTKWIFTGKKLEVYIPAVYGERGLLELGSIITSLGIFQLRINDQFYSNLLILGKLNLSPSDHDTITEDGYDYVVLNFVKDDVFITNTDIVKNGNLAYEVFMMFLALGKIPPFIDYNSIQTLFDNDKKCCDISLNVNHTIFEMIFAHMYRDKSDAFKFYRLTTMKEPPVIVPIHQISHGPTSNSSRIMGSYMREGTVSALINDPDPNDPSKIENLMRA